MKCEQCDYECETQAQMNGHMMHHKRADRNETRKEDRTKRVPFGVPELKLNADIEKGKTGRWVNDEGDRVERAKRGAYALVLDEEGVPKKKVVGKHADGSSKTAYLMQIDTDIYDEDQASKQEKIDRMDAQIHNKNFEGDSNDNRYVPESHPRSVQVST